MRRLHVYERSVPRARRDVEQESQDDYVPVARAAIAALPALLRAAEAAGAERGRGDSQAGDVTSLSDLAAKALVAAIAATLALWVIRRGRMP